MPLSPVSSDDGKVEILTRVKEEQIVEQAALALRKGVHLLVPDVDSP